MSEEVFTYIYENNVWGLESVSGSGSTMFYTRPLRGALPTILERNNVNVIFDAPCGDFGWMREVLKEVDVHYIGGDIVKPLVESLKPLETDKIEFRHFDITKDEFPKADMWFCRDCLFHLSYDDIFKALRLFLDSGIPLLMTTKHPGRNQDIQTGGFRPLNLCEEPFKFSPDPLDRVDDYISGFLAREMVVWSREQVAEAIG